MSELLGLELPDGQGTVWFGSDPKSGWQNAGPVDAIVGKLDESPRPLSVDARLLSDRVWEFSPDEAAVKRGKISVVILTGCLPRSPQKAA